MSNREFTPTQQFSIRQDAQDNIRLLVVGNPGVGKTTLANALGKISKFPVLHLDEVQWHADGKEIIEISKEEFAGIVEKFIQENPNWIIDGDYTEAIGPLREPYSPGCEERWGEVFTLGEKSIVWWCWMRHDVVREINGDQILEDKDKKWIRIGDLGDLLKVFQAEFGELVKSQ
ncbi:hypothetical protein Clacol_004034 [Clathrus columnatus]|uniref:ATPase AAA-type core domain-containing protein n=1 Tax=Clathrus columnatus TaxID=1419009 RepID=A0AAV5A697_9AGAM|nr:hypothetical protein Clacol_004034 [Clathrus columnatus]